MQQWEYLSGTVEDDAEASRLGMEGWELVGVVNIPGGSDPIYHFKRQLRQYKTGVKHAATTREDLISGGGTEREKELFQMGYEWGLKQFRITMDERVTEEAIGQRIKDAISATAFGCLAAATGKPLSDASKEGFKPRTLQGDAWETGWEFMTEELRTTNG